MQVATERRAAAAAHFRPYSGIMWLASYPRSGNTWTRVFLYNVYRVTAGDRGPMDFAGLQRFAPWDKGASLYSAFLKQSIRDLTREQVAALRPKLQEAVAARARGYAFFKTHSGRFLDHGQPLINPAAFGGAVYIIRNPLDVAVSYARHVGAAIDRVIGVMGQPGWTSPPNDQVAHEIIGSWSENVRSWTTPPHDGLFVLRYEDAVARPFEVFGALARHVGLTPDRLQLGLAVEYSSFERMQQQESEGGFPEISPATKQHFRVGRATGWREQLNPRQVDRIVRAHGEQMQRFGYLP